MSQAYTPPGIPPGAEPESPPPKSVYLVSYPKIVFLYPTLIAALIAGCYMLLPQNEDHSDSHFVSLVFMMVLTVNLVVFAFDFPRTTSLTLFFFLAAVVLGLLLLFRFNSQILPALHRIFDAYKPEANATFFFSIAGVLSAIYLAVLI